MTLTWTREALENLSLIDAFISRDNPDRAEIFISEIIGYAETLVQNPRIGRIVPELSNTDIRELILKKYRIVYRIQKDTIEILTVFEGHKLLEMEETD